MMNDYIITATAESGNEYAFAVRSKVEPTVDQIDTMLYKEIPDETILRWESVSMEWLFLPSQEEISEMKSKRQIG